MNACVNNGIVCIGKNWNYSSTESCILALSVGYNNSHSVTQLSSQNVNVITKYRLVYNPTSDGFVRLDIYTQPSNIQDIEIICFGDWVAQFVRPADIIISNDQTTIEFDRTEGFKQLI